MANAPNANLCLTLKGELTWILTASIPPSYVTKFAMHTAFPAATHDTITVDVTYSPTCLCQSMFDSEGRIDVDTDCLHSTLLRNEIRDAHCIPRCYPRHNHRRCHLFAHLPTHRPRHSGRVNDPY